MTANITYNQRHGDGVNLSPTIAKLVMHILLDELQKQCLTKSHLSKKYVDHLILAVPAMKAFDAHNKFNTYNNHNQLTAEIEEYNQIAFLDGLLIYNIHITICTKLYRKNIYSFDLKIPIVLTSE